MQPLDLLREDEAEFLASLEQRIQKAVDMVGALRRENATLAEKLKAVEGERDRAESLLAAAREDAAQLQRELEMLQTERKQVRSRIEKLLSQMEALGAV